MARKKQQKPMLGKLFGSNARVKILKLFLLNPEKKFYIRQIARDLNVQLNSVRRELENLEKFGLLISSFDNKTDDSCNEPVLLAHGKLTASDPASKGFYPDALIERNFSDKISAASERESAKSIYKPANRQEKRYYKVSGDFVLLDELKVLISKAQILYEQDFVAKIQKAGAPKVLILTGLFVNNPNSIVDILAVGKFDKDKFAKVIKELESELGREVNYTIMDAKEFRYRRDITDVFLFGILEGRKHVVVDELGAC